MQRVWDLPHSKLTSVEFIAIDGHKVIVDLPTGEDCELSIKRSLLDDLLLKRARDLGVHVHEETTITALSHSSAGKACSHGPATRPVLDAPQERGCNALQRGWKIETTSGQSFLAQVLVGADGRNSTVARLRNLLPRPARERVALQAHIPLPRDFGKRIVLQFLREGYSGQSPVNDKRPQSLPRRQASHYFQPAAMGATTLRNRRRSTLAHHHTTHPRACSLRPRKSSFYRGRCARRGAVYRRRNLLRTSLRRARCKCDCGNYQRQRSTISTQRIHSCLRGDISRKTLDQSTGARCGFISSHRFALCPCSAN